MKSFKKTILKFFLVIFSICSISLILYYRMEYTNTSEDDFITLMKKSNMTESLDQRLKVQVLNGCGAKGVADLYTNYLREYDYDVVDFKNADNFNYSSTTIIVHNNNLFVEDLADLLNINSKNIDYLFTKNIFYDLTVIIGKDYKQLDSYNDVSLHINPYE